MTPEDVLEYWFHPDNQSAWFNATPDIDDDIRARFLSYHTAASGKALKHWESSAEGCLALVIILDQFPLNMFRGEPESFSTEADAIEVSLHAIGLGFDQSLKAPKQAFLYMPLMHSENLDHQNQSVACFEAAGLKENLRFAQHHREIIQRFGRFPHRNDILGRKSTSEEQDWLASDKAFRG